MEEKTVAVKKDEVSKGEDKSPRLYPNSSLSSPVRDLSDTFSGIEMIRKYYGM